jgi:hypothetical protein
MQLSQGEMQCTSKQRIDLTYHFRHFNRLGAFVCVVLRNYYNSF